MRYEVAPLGIDVALVQPGPFGTGLLAGGQAPTRTVVAITLGVDEMNAVKQPIQDRVLKEMQLGAVLGGTDV